MKTILAKVLVLGLLLAVQCWLVVLSADSIIIRLDIHSPEEARRLCQEKIGSTSKSVACTERVGAVWHIITPMDVNCIYHELDHVVFGLKWHEGRGAPCSERAFKRE